LEWSRRDEQPRYTRVELNHSVVDFLATPEYARGAPQAPAYVFLLDVSQGAINSGLSSHFLLLTVLKSNQGMFHTAIRTIAENLDNIPNEQLRTKVAIICYDVSLYFFSMPVSLNQIITSFTMHVFDKS
jgi:protein transport protein SEC24